jgi:hypothetical protein
VSQFLIFDYRLAAAKDEGLAQSLQQPFGVVRAFDADATLVLLGANPDVENIHPG